MRSDKNDADLYEKAHGLNMSPEEQRKQDAKLFEVICWAERMRVEKEYIRKLINAQVDLEEAGYEYYSDLINDSIKAIVGEPL